MKTWWKSKTIWVGIVTLVYSILEFTGVVSTGLTPELLASILGVIVIILRFITKEDIVWKSAK